MKVLHAAALLSPPAGILNQMIWEQEAADLLNINWHTYMFCPQDSVLRSRIIVEAKVRYPHWNRTSLQGSLCWLSLRKQYYAWLREQSKRYDVLLLRYYVHDPYQWVFVRTCTIPIVFVHHALELPELAMPGGCVSRIRSRLEGILGHATLPRARALVALTPEILQYERERCRNPTKPGFLYPNGIVFLDRAYSDERGEVPELLFVASSFVAWHGLDLLIDSAQASTEKFLVHVVGDVVEEDLLRLSSDPHFIVHGKKTHEEISAIAGRCWVGLSSFALFRKQMQEACTIKVREYLMMGLPVYAGYRDVFPNSFPYYRQGSANLEEILLFSQQMRGMSREEIAALSRPYIDKCTLLAKLHAWLGSGFENAN